MALVQYYGKWRLSQIQRKQDVFKLHDTQSGTSVQWWFTTPHGKPAPTRKSIYKWHKSFVETGCLCEKKRAGRQPNLETVDRVREVY
jgi:hypothetical protein